MNLQNDYKGGNFVYHVCSKMRLVPHRELISPICCKRVSTKRTS